MKIYYRNCKKCGKAFETTKRAQTYCDDCKGHYPSQARPKKELLTMCCPICGRMFQQTHPKQRYCSVRCRDGRGAKTGNYMESYSSIHFEIYKQSRLVQCAKIAKDAGMTYGEAERAGLFANI